MKNRRGLRSLVFRCQAPLKMEVKAAHGAAPLYLEFCGSGRLGRKRAVDLAMIWPWLSVRALTRMGKIPIGFETAAAG